MERGVTIRDVAREAGVSATTVSRVFNRGELVNEETRARVLNVAKRLQYIPNATARSLSIRKTRVLGLILPMLYSESFTETIRGMDEQALELDYNLLISGSHNRIEDTLSAFRMMKGRVDGFMVVPHNIELAVLADMTPRGIPAIFLHSPDPKGVFQTLSISNFKGAYQATQHLIELGHRDIAFIKGPDANPEAQERLRGYRRALADAGLTPIVDREFSGDFSYNSGLRAARLVLQCQPAPTAIFACNDRMAIGVLRVLHGAGRHVPDDVAVIGFDDIPSALYVTPMLSTVRVPFYHMGRRAVQLLVERLNSEEKTMEKMVSEVFPTRLIPRSSTIGAAYQSDRAYQHTSSN